MNKMLFSEGGQPLYIDDLKTLQENPTNQMSALLQALGANTSVFLLERFQGELKKLNEGDKTTTFQTKKNWLVLDGIIYEIKETTLVAHSWNDPLYVGVRKSTSDVRTFEDGQERACRETAEAFLTFEKTEGVFNVSELKTLFDLIAPSIVIKLSETEYKDMPWTSVSTTCCLWCYCCRSKLRQWSGAGCSHPSAIGKRKTHRKFGSIQSSFSSELSN